MFWPAAQGPQGPAGAKGDTGDPGATGPAGPTTVSARIPGSLTTSSGTQTISSSVGPLAAAKTLAANSIKLHFGAGYSASNTSNWKWTPGYWTPGTPGTFTAIGSGRQNNVAGGAVAAMSTETYAHAEVTIPQGSIPAAQAVPTNFPSPNTGYSDTIVEFFRQ